MSSVFFIAVFQVPHNDWINPAVNRLIASWQDVNMTEVSKSDDGMDD